VHVCVCVCVCARADEMLHPDERQGLYEYLWLYYCDCMCVCAQMKCYIQMNAKASAVADIKQRLQKVRTVVSGAVQS